MRSLSSSSDDEDAAKSDIMRTFKVKLLHTKYVVTIDNTIVIDGFLAELTQIKKDGNRDFHHKTDNNCKHHRSS